MASETQTTEAPVLLELELVRAEQADDAFAFRFARQTYLVRGRQGAYETVELPWSRELLRDLEELRSPDRDPATVARIGELLRELLSHAGWSRHETSIVDARTARHRVHVTIRSAAAELYALPWELLSLRADGQHLGALDHVLLRYAWPGTSTVAPDPERARAPGRLLLAWSAAGGAVPAAEQTKAIEEAARAAKRDEAVEVLPSTSYGAIADALAAAKAAERPFSALHLLCHGAEAGSTFGLALDAEGGEGRPAVIDAGRLQQLLAPYADTLRLVVVSACDGGNMGQPGNRIGSVAQRLHRAGLQYVVASRYPLSNRGSTRMTGALYQALLAGEPVERAFVEARTAASREVSQLDWASLQLYARPEDGDRGCVLAAAKKEEDIATAVAPVPVVVAAPFVVPSGAAPSDKSKLGMTLVIAAAATALGLGLLFASKNHQDDSRDADEVAVVPTRIDVPQPSPSPVPEPTPSPAAATDADHESTGGSDSEMTTAMPEPKRPSKPAVHDTKPKPAISSGRPTKRCDDLLVQHINDRLTSPTTKGLYSIEAWVREDGRVELGSCSSCGDQLAGAKSGMARVPASTVTSRWKDELPCRAKFDWQ